MRIRLLFKYLYRLFVVVAAIGALAFVGVMVYIGNLATSCGEDSEAVAYARSLSKERLGRLYRDMEDYSVKADLPREGYYPDNENQQIPDAFADLKVRRVRPRDGNIMVEGCLDHYVYMKFEGVGFLKEFDEKRQIVLSWGEYPPHAGSQVLWAERAE